MNHRIASALAAVTLIGTAVTAAGPAVGDEGSAAQRATLRSVILTGPKDVTEGDLYTITVKVAAPRKAKTVQLQALRPEYAGDSTPVWVVVKTRKVNATANHTFRALADAGESQRYRAVATYVDGKPIWSKAMSVRVWHWTDLSRYTAYYKVGTVYDESYWAFAMNGDTWEGWRTRSSMAESRYTLGRNCKSFRGTMGVDDFTDDGGTAQITLLTDESNVVYTSPTLVPGEVVNVQLDLELPYRFSIQGRNTSPDDGIVRDVYPAIGAAQFLCHFS